MLSEALEKNGVSTCLTREPGDTMLGARLRALLLDRNGEPMSRKAEMLLFAADRAEHVEKVIKPNLDQGKVVICDRYMASTMAYQAYAGDLDKTAVQIISEWASDALYPDVTYFLDVMPVVGLERAKRVERTRFEDKTVDYHDRVRRGFLAQRNNSWSRVDAHESIEEMHKKILLHALGIIHVLNSVTSTKRGGLTSVSLVEKETYQDAVAAIRDYQAPEEKSQGVTCPQCGRPLRNRTPDGKWYVCENGHDKMLMTTKNSECGFDGCIAHPLVVS
jgi:dTMP kinase